MMWWAMAGVALFAAALWLYLAAGRRVADEPLSPIQEAVLAGDSASVDALLSAGADANGMVPLTFELLPGGQIRFMMSRPLSGSHSAPGCTPYIVCATLHGHSDLVALLLRHGASANASDDRGQTALAVAAWRGDSVIVRALLQAGASTRPGGTTIRTPLEWAEEAGHAEVAAVLRSADRGGPDDER